MSWFERIAKVAFSPILGMLQMEGCEPTPSRPSGPSKSAEDAPKNSDAPSEQVSHGELPPLPPVPGYGPSYVSDMYRVFDRHRNDAPGFYRFRLFSFRPFERSEPAIKEEFIKLHPEIKKEGIDEIYRAVLPIAEEDRRFRLSLMYGPSFGFCAPDHRGEGIKGGLK